MKTAPMLRSSPKRVARPVASSLRDSIYSLLTGTPVATGPEHEQKVSSIRARMLSELVIDSTRHARAIRHVQYADDVQSLWFLRGEVMAALSAEYGEMEARSRLDRISRMFEGLLPRSLKSRPSPLTF